MKRVCSERFGIRFAVVQFDLVRFEVLWIAMSELDRMKREEARGSEEVRSRRDQGLRIVRIRDVLCICAMDHAQQ